MPTGSASAPTLCLPTGQPARQPGQGMPIRAANEEPGLLNPQFEALLSGQCATPFDVLGPQQDGNGGLRLRVWLPGAAGVTAVLEDGHTLPLQRLHAAGLFEGCLTQGPQPVPPDDPQTCGHQAPVAQCPAYQLHIDWSGVVQVTEDPYRFGCSIGDMDLWLFAEGRHTRPYTFLGAHPATQQGVTGTRFAVWAPNARRVSVTGDFNTWDSRRHSMQRLAASGIWCLFIPGVTPGSRYKFELCLSDGQLAEKSDPFGFGAELRPATASVVQVLPDLVPSGDRARQQANALDAPVSIYEVHAASWRRVPEQDNRFLDWDELASTLIPYAADLGFTHIELLPISEHPFDGSWGYQPVGLYAPTARHGDAQGLCRFVRAAHASGLGVILDWVPGHFPSDAHGLGHFDGTCLYEHADPREGFHQDWNTLIYNFGRNEVRNLLVGNALYWLERYGVDGLRVDAVASMLYRDYSRKAGEWIPNRNGGRENLEAIGFLREMNAIVGNQRPEAVTAAEESTAWPMVSRPPDMGGLGFHYKWNMGWMNDTLQYMQKDPIHRRHHHHQLTFGLVYAFTENFGLPLSHDEVVHGKRSLLGKMPGDRWQQFANLRAYLGFMWGHPGKKLLFMGGEFAQAGEWDHDRSLDWHLLQDPAHAGVQRLVRDLNHLYRSEPALYRRDCTTDGFEWLEMHDADRSVLAFARRGSGADALMVVVCNFTPMPRHDYRLGVPGAGRYQERLNTDAAAYGGSNMGNAFGEVQAEAITMHGRAWSVNLTLPPLGVLFLQWHPETR